MGGLRTWRFAHGTHDPLVVTAMVVDGEDDAVAVCGCDVVWMNNEFVTSVRKRVADRTDLAARAILISASHTHNGPAMSPMIYPNVPPHEYEENLVEQVTETLVAATENCHAASIRAGTAQEPDVLENRRCRYRAQTDPSERDDLLYHLENGERPAPENVDGSRVSGERAEVDGEIGFFTAESGGDTFGTFLNFACHPTNVGGDLHDCYSGDFVSVVRDELAEAFGPDHHTVFGQGASGELRPAERADGFDVPVDVGQTLAGDVTGTQTDRIPETAEVAWTAETVTLPRRRPTEDHLSAARDVLERYSGTENEKVLWAAHEALVLEDSPETHDVEVWVARIGDIAFVALPGELFHEFGLVIKRASPFERTFVIELANGYCGYVPTRAAFRRGGYEVILATSSYLERDAGDELTDAALDLLDSL